MVFKRLEKVKLLPYKLNCNKTEIGVVKLYKL